MIIQHYGGSEVIPQKAEKRISEADHAANVRWLLRQGFDGHGTESAESKASLLEQAENLGESDQLLRKLMIIQRHSS